MVFLLFSVFLNIHRLLLSILSCPTSAPPFPAKT
jgi:hypothetical protein